MIYIYPSFAPRSSEVLIANTSVGSSFLDTTRDDDFSAGSVDLGLWSVTTTGIFTAITGAGLDIELRKNSGGSSYQLDSNQSYISGDISITYKILSQLVTNNPASSLIYASLELIFNSTTKFRISRTITPGINGHQVLVELIIDNISRGSASHLTTDTMGQLRLIKVGGNFTAIYNSIILFHAINVPLNDFTVRLLADTNGQSDFLKTKFSYYRSNPGVLIGDMPIHQISLITKDRINGMAPISNQSGLVDVIVFNHDGVLGALSPGFEYPLIAGTSLSPNGGMIGTIQGDSILR